MAETYSTEYASLFNSAPAVKTMYTRHNPRTEPFTYTQVLAGTAADTCLLAKLPPKSMLLLPSSTFYFAGFTSGMTLSIGWQAYTDVNGATVAASATGLFNAADVSNGVGMLHGGMQTAATPDDENPVVGAIMKDFNNRSSVVIFATFGAQVPGANAVLNGYLMYVSA